MSSNHGNKMEFMPLNHKYVVLLQKLHKFFKISKKKDKLFPGFSLR